MYQDAYETIQTLISSKFITKITFLKNGKIDVYFINDKRPMRFKNMTDILETIEMFESGELK